jgi:hypothetical protein
MKDNIKTNLDEILAYEGEEWISFTHTAQGAVAGTSECGSGWSGFIRAWEFVRKSSRYQFPKNTSAAWN